MFSSKRFYKEKKSFFLYFVLLWKIVKKKKDQIQLKLVVELYIF